MAEIKSAPTEVRWLLPEEVIKKIKKHKHRLSLHWERNFTQEEAFIHMMRAIEIPEDLHLKEHQA